MAAYLAYVDDSGDNQLDLLSAVLIPFQTWQASLAGWLDFRRRLVDEHGIPTAYELHANEFLNGRGRPSKTGAPINTSRTLRRQIGEQALTVIAAMPDVGVITVARRGSAAQRRLTYGRLVDELDVHLEQIDGQAIVVVDGDQLHPAYHLTHRDLKLADRRVIEDPWMQGSHVSQLVQVADLVVYCAYQHLTRPERHRQMWPWYEQHILSLHVVGRPDIIWA